MDLANGTQVTVTNPGTLAVTVDPPTPHAAVVVATRGPAGKDGLDGQAGAASDASIAESIANPTSQTRGALVPVIDDTTEPLIDLVLLFDNANT